MGSTASPSALTARTGLAARMSGPTLPLIVVVAVAIALRLPGLVEPIWYDEVWATSVVLRNLPDSVAALLYDVHPPLYGALMFGWIHVFGDSELSIRLPSLIAGVTTVALMPVLGRRLATERAGWIAAGLLALSPVHIWFSREARPYALLMLLAVAVVLVAGTLASAEESKRRNAWFLVVSLALVLTHYYGIFILAAVVLWSFRMPANARRVVLSTAVGCAAMLLALFFLKARVGVMRTGAWYLGAFTLESIPQLMRWLLVGSFPGTPLPRVLVAFALAVAALVVVGLLSRAPDRYPRAVLAGLILGTPAVLLLIGFAGFDHYYLERSALGILPFLVLAAALGADSLGGVNSATSRLALVMLATGSIASITWHLTNRDGLTVAYPRPDWRSAEPIFQSYREASPGRAPVFLGTTPLDELLYYRRGTQRCTVRVVDSVTAPLPFQCQESPGATPTSDHVYMLLTDRVANLRRVMSAESAKDAMLIVRSSWRMQDDALLENVRRSDELTLTPVATVRGLEIWRISVGDPMARAQAGVPSR